MAQYLAVDEQRSTFGLVYALHSAETVKSSASQCLNIPPADVVPILVQHALDDVRKRVESSVAPAELESPATHEILLAMLEKHSVKFDILTHAPTKTSEESAAVRGVPLASGAKAMLLKAGKPLAHGGLYLLAVMAASNQVDWGRLRKLLASPKLSMASLDEVSTLTGCVPGAVPPFGSLFEGVKTVLDNSVITQGPEINFNAGLRTVSVLHLAVEDYLRIEKPEILEFTSAPK